MLVIDNMLVSDFIEQFSVQHLEEVMSSVSEKYIDANGSHPLKDLIDNKALLEEISEKCLAGQYKFSPYREKLFLKGKKKFPREISIPSSKDKSILKCLNTALKQLCPISNSTRIASFIVKDIKDYILTIKSQEVTIVRLDIKEYFDKIDHDLLFEKIQQKKCPDWLIKLTENAVKNPTKNLYTREKIKRKTGIPQGISIASHLADLYLEEFDKECASKCFQYYRYVDDMLLFIPSSEKDNILDFIKLSMGKLKLEMHSESGKYQIITLSENVYFDYLGYTFYPFENRISIKDSSVQKYLNSLIGLITKYRKGGYNKQYRTIKNAKNAFYFDLNEKITGAYVENKRYGWLWYFKQMNDIGLLEKLDNIIKKELLKSNKTKNILPKKLKRTYYEIVHKDNNSNYSLNYGSQDINYMKKILSSAGAEFSSDEKDSKITWMFKEITNRRLRRLALDEERHS